MWHSPAGTASRRALLHLSIILLVLLALLPLKKAIGVEPNYAGDQLQAGQDTPDWVALVHCVNDPQVPGEPVYLFPADTISLPDSPVVSGRCYRGPPVLS